MPARFLSGIQPSGELHLGNYFGAIVEHIRLQSDGESSYFIANYHALTSLRDPAKLRQFTADTAITYLSCGLDPSRAVLFRQSDVPEVCELTWLLLTVAPMPMLENATSYKDKVAKGIPADAGLFTYPILMAADILAQDADVVPVGKDQVQHVEMTADAAGKFNRFFKSQVFKVPKYRLGEAPYVPGTDGGKMSKSYGNVIGIFDEGRALEKAVMGIKTDSKGVAEPKDPESDTIFKLYSLMSTKDEQAALAERYRAGGMGYGEAKKLLLARIEERFAPFRQARAGWLSRPKDVEDVLQAGAAKARKNARAVLDRARAACGLA
jgi:tryptophanyl-tRNA synthetase